MRILLAALTASLLLSACGGTKIYDVQSYGADQYVVHSKSKNAAEAQSKSLQAANEYCAGKSKTMQPVKNGKVARAQFEFIFTCN